MSFVWLFSHATFSDMLERLYTLYMCIELCSYLTSGSAYWCLFLYMLQYLITHNLSVPHAFWHTGFVDAADFVEEQGKLQAIGFACRRYYVC